jgi:hypothetical protein
VTRWRRHLIPLPPDRLRPWQQQRIPELDDMFDASGIDDLYTCKEPNSNIHEDVTRPMNHVVEPIERQFDKVVFWVVGQT